MFAHELKAIKSTDGGGGNPILRIADLGNPCWKQHTGFELESERNGAIPVSKSGTKIEFDDKSATTAGWRFTLAGTGMEQGGYLVSSAADASLSPQPA